MVDTAFYPEGAYDLDIYPLLNYQAVSLISLMSAEFSHISLSFCGFTVLSLLLNIDAIRPFCDLLILHLTIQSKMKSVVI